ncbi:type II toxin-antitoxin system VapC family toxin [Faunimonas sp. B44]|uniref:type II toxin-antitoxin system VapC family toxin n=1 Tax=Faunimonas sp. B44 TaxID=3461493 RepID=UPI0040446B3A
MTRFVIDSGTALRIVEEEIVPGLGHSLLAPTLLRSEVLNLLYRRVRRGELDGSAGLALKARFGRLKVRYLGDAVLRRRAWELAARADMESTFGAEYLALTQLQADALIAEDGALRESAAGLVRVVPLSALRA